MMVLWHNEEIHLHRHDKLNCKRRRHWNMFRCDISFPHYYKSTLVFVPIEAKLCKWSFLWDHFLFPSVLRTHSIHSVESAGQLINPIKIQNVDTDWIFMFSVKIIYSLLATWGLSSTVCLYKPSLSTTAPCALYYYWMCYFSFQEDMFTFITVQRCLTLGRMMTDIIGVRSSTRWTCSPLKEPR